MDVEAGHLQGLCEAAKRNATAVYCGTIEKSANRGGFSLFASLVLEFVRNGYFNGQTIRLDGAIRMAPR